jgi:hypothetical protein
LTDPLPLCSNPDYTLAGVKDGAEDLVAALGRVNDRQGDIRAGWAEVINRQQGVRDMLYNDVYNDAYLMMYTMMYI